MPRTTLDRPFNFRLDAALLRRAEDRARARGVSLSELARAALRREVSMPNPKGAAR